MTPKLKTFLLDLLFSIVENFIKINFTKINGRSFLFIKTFYLHLFKTYYTYYTYYYTHYTYYKY